MTINRNNYEEYLLLYADNELPPAERQLVEQFLAANPDLEEELSSLQQAVLTPDPLLFDDKASLLKNTSIPKELQVQMLLSIDGELPGADEKQLKELIANDAILSKEWSLLQQTKLPEEPVIFDEKARLYKKENDRVIPMGWWRMAAAALLVGFGIWGTVSYVNRNVDNVENPVAINDPSNTPTAPTQQIPVVVKTKESVGATTNTEVVITQDNNAGESKRSISVQKQRVEKQQQTGLSAINSMTNNAALKNREEDIQQTALQTINNANRNNVPLQNVPPSTNNNLANAVVLTNNESNDNSVAFNETTAPNNTVRYASFDEDDDDEKPKRKRAGGFLKQVKRVLERKANIKSSADNSIKIANMSFAMH